MRGESPSPFLPEWLPREILSAVGACDSQVGDPYPGESALVESAVPPRRLEFLTGRLLARTLLDRLGYEPAPLLSEPDRSPAWPPGVIGSITHTAGLCGVAIVPSGRRFLGVGIDAEQHQPLEDRISHYVLTERERHWLRSFADPERRRLSMIGFSAKEAIYKCLHPLGNAGLGFKDVELQVSPGSSTIVVHPGPELARRVPAEATLECGFSLESGFVQTAAVLLTHA